MLAVEDGCRVACMQPLSAKANSRIKLNRGTRSSRASHCSISIRNPAKIMARAGAAAAAMPRPPRSARKTHPDRRSAAQIFDAVGQLLDDGNTASAATRSLSGRLRNAEGDLPGKALAAIPHQEIDLLSGPTRLDEHHACAEAGLGEPPL